VPTMDINSALTRRATRRCIRTFLTWDPDELALNPPADVGLMGLRVGRGGIALATVISQKTGCLVLLGPRFGGA